MIFDVTEDDFQERVLDRSREVPVVVDFWAEWCGPCRVLTPVLEKAVTERGERIDLAKIDTDANPRISQAFGIQGIPAVKAFKDGRVAAEFVGAQPPAKVDEFLDGLLPSEAENLIAEGGEENLRRAIELEPANNAAAVDLARLLAERGDVEEARRLVEGRPGFAAEGLAARLALQEADPSLAEAFAAIDAGDTEAGLDRLLEALSAAPDAERRDAIRQAIVGVLDQLGVEHPLARESRRRMAAALY